ncbi:MAG: RNA methyltransferase [Flavobacteriales bacterium]|nr:RNA methyltransferase [Flavobacteriales bacterium]
MLTASKVKLIKSLNKKKFRQKYNLFVCEGNKIIKELIKSDYNIENIYCTQKSKENINFSDINLVEENEIRKISFLTNPSDSLAVVRIPESKLIQSKKIQLILDDIQDPGNLGTIIRLCDWFGIEQIICSNNTVDVYNPKVIQASMASFLRVNVFYTDLQEFLKKSKIPIVSTAMQGESLYEFKVEEPCYIVLGNEGNGISEDVFSLSNSKITIPQFSNHQQTESLNVAMATSVILSQLVGNQ